MASGDDFFNQLKQANDKLSDLAPLRSDVEQLSAVLSSSLNQLVSQGSYSNLALYQNTLQNVTIICILEKISKNTCEILNQACIQTALQTQIQKNTAAMADILAAAHPEAALMREREQALRTEIEKCCPPPASKPCCNYVPCKAPPEIEPPPSGDVIL
jgi:hypothetical protein